MIAQIAGYSNYYVTDGGVVFSRWCGIDDPLVPRINNSGYHRVRISDDDAKLHEKLVHRLVAEAFIPNPEGLPEVNHIDRDKSNNSVNNLEWCSHLENMQHFSTGHPQNTAHAT